MSPSAVAIFVNPPPILTQFPTHRKPPFSSPCFVDLKLRKSKFVYCKSVRLNYKPMASDEHVGSPISALEQEAFVENGGVAFHQTPGGLNTVVNNLSKWIVAATFGGLQLLRHDSFALWAAMGAVLNVMLSVTLKKILKQERPDTRLSSGHGMPSSHAQSIFFTIVFVIISVIEWQGFNGVTAIMCMLVAAIGSYFAWLRVSQRYHTSIQVVVGAIVGSVFAVLWFWAWKAIVQKAYDSSLLVRTVVIIGAVAFSLGFISHVIRHWLKDED